jgi:hypothetical protein
MLWFGLALRRTRVPKAATLRHRDNRANSRRNNLACIGGSVSFFLADRSGVLIGKVTRNNHLCKKVVVDGAAKKAERNRQPKRSTRLDLTKSYFQY